MAIPGSAAELFDEKLPAVLAKHPELRKAGMVYCMNITGAGGGKWSIDLVSPVPTCKPGASPDARCTIEVGLADFKNVLLQPNLATQLYFQGRIKVQGDVLAVTRLQPLFALMA